MGSPAAADQVGSGCKLAGLTATAMWLALSSLFLACPGWAKLKKGADAPGFSLSGLDGGTYALADYKGKVLVLDFWATWCRPCRMELPEIEKAWQTLKKQREAGQVQFLLVNTDPKNEKTILALQKDLSLTIPVVLDKDNKASISYEVESIPRLFLIDGQGKVISIDVGYRPGVGSSLVGKVRFLLPKPVR